jgi:hypothetical protein
MLLRSAVLVRRKCPPVGQIRRRNNLADEARAANQADAPTRSGQLRHLPRCGDHASLAVNHLDRRLRAHRGVRDRSSATVPRAERDATTKVASIRYRKSGAEAADGSSLADRAAVCLAARGRDYERHGGRLARSKDDRCGICHNRLIATSGERDVRHLQRKPAKLVCRGTVWPAPCQS